jgi:hypothetical protein
VTFVSVTRLRLRSLRFLPAFLWTNELVVRQLTASPGFRKGRLLIDKHRTFWTLTLWSDQASVRQFRDAAAHRVAMPKLLNWCDEASLAHWEQSEDALPDWTDAWARLLREGRASKVRHPSAEHAQLAFPAPRAGFLQRPLLSRQP